MTSRMKIQGKTYKVPALEDLTIDDILVLDAELQERYNSSWVKVQRFVAETQDMTEDEAEQHPMGTLMGGVTVWMVLRVAGKQSITMREALAIPSDSVEEIVMEGPKDHQAKKPKSKSRKRSAPAAGPRPVPESTSSSLSTISSDESASA